VCMSSGISLPRSLVCQDKNCRQTFFYRLLVHAFAQMVLKVKLGWLRYVESIRKVSIVDNYSSYFPKSEAIPLGMERVLDRHFSKNNCTTKELLSLSLGLR